ncbi:MAG: SgcJ/EcaC family oxidoreductase [Planctomycetes bacterium]|nr:SgcJ/EcaC family oxidoreductase [Planctomycetota bacterium]
MTIRLRWMATALAGAMLVFAAGQLAAQDGAPPADTPCGIGVVLQQDGERHVIGEVLPDSPAGRAGLKSGQVIVAVDGKPVAGLSAKELVQRITGPSGTDVTLTLLGDNGQVEVTMKRAPLKVPSASASMSDAGVGIIRVRYIGTDGIREAVRTLIGQGASRLVLDLRRAGGGPLADVQTVLELFVGTGQPLFEVHRQGKPSLMLNSESPAMTGLPLVVLVSENTAAGSEIVAGALKQTKRAVVLGRKTAGRLEIKEALKRPDGSTVVLPTGNLRLPGLPDGGVGGIVPDRELPEGASDDDVMAAVRETLASMAGADEAAVRALALQFVGMLRKGDRTTDAQIAAMLADDSLQVTSRGTTVRGKDALREFYGKAMTEADKLCSQFTSRYDIERVRISGDMAMVFGRIAITGRLAEGDAPFERNIWETLVFMRQDNQWRLWHEHSTLVSAEP